VLLLLNSIANENVKKVLLFDIDGTLLSSGGAGQIAMERALVKAFSVELAEYKIETAGRTDRGIVSDLFTHHDIALDESIWAHFQSIYFEELPVVLGSGRARVLPGVPDLLEGLAQHDRALMGVMTGNFERGADIKLSHFGLEKYFSFGFYGDDHHHRDDMARMAWQLTRERVWEEATPGDVWVIGDTPADIQCARAIGAKVIAVATGMYSRDLLSGCNPDLLLNTLENSQLIIETIFA